MTAAVMQQEAQTLSDRVFGSAIGALDLLSIYLGDRLGLYAAIKQGAVTAEELARRAGIHPRYAREWLEQQAVTGILSVAGTGQDAHSRVYSLSAGYAEALTDPDSLYSVVPLARACVSIAQTLPAVVEAYKSGGGVPWSAYGVDGIEAQGDFNRPWIVQLLTSEYLPAIPDVHRRLSSAPPARVAEIACGVGWAGVSIARAYPSVRVDAFDLDDLSLRLAREHAARYGVQDRVRFQRADSTNVSEEEAYDLVLMIEALHDLPRPVETLAAMRRMTVAGGAVIVADERTAEQFTAPGDEAERLFYGASITLCLPASMSDQPSAATGTVIRPQTVREYAEKAGFTSIEELGIEHPMLRFYRLG